MSVEDLFETLSALREGQSYPPVHKWQPAQVGTIDIRIDAEGGWHHEGAPIRRERLVRLFSTVLRKDPDGYYLVTPVEQLRIEVADAPFIAVDVETRATGAEQELLFTTNVGDYVLADAEHPLWLEQAEGQPRPYLHVRNGLNARISRPVYYRLAELCETDGQRYWLRSCGERFLFS